MSWPVADVEGLSARETRNYRRRKARRARRKNESPDEREARLKVEREYQRRYREKHPDRVREHKAASRERNRDDYNARRRARYAKLTAQQRAERRKRWKVKPKNRKEYNQAWQAKNPGYANQAARDRYMLDPEYFKARSRAYYAANRERILAARRAKRGSLGFGEDVAVDR